MFKKDIYVFLVLLITSLYGQNTFSQLLTNNSGLIHVSTGAIVMVSGNIDNLAGSQFENSGILTVSGDITNDAGFQSPGTIELSGNWINNSGFIAQGGSVTLEGGYQTLGGTNLTTFHNLVLNGSGIKSLLHNINISGSLTLNDKELAIGNFNLFIENTSPGAINRTTGFISNNLTGRLIHRTNSVSSYLFPMGSSTGTNRYRPVEITPYLANINKYSVGFINHDANNDALNRNQADNNICQLNDLYYHHIAIDSGSALAVISIYFDLLSDGNWTTSANWKTTPTLHWEKTDSALLISGSPFNRIDILNWIFSGTSAFILGKPAILVDLGPDKNGCQGDTFTLSTTALYSNYQWSTSQNSSNIQVTNAGTFSVTVTTNGCSAADTIEVTTIQLPIANAGTDISICNGSFAQLNASGGATYNWLVTNNLSNASINNPVASPSNTTSYIVEVANGPCKDYDTVEVTVLPIPFASAGPDTTIYSGKPYQLSAIAPTAVTVIWSPPDGLSNTYILNPVSTLSENTTYLFTVYDINSCSYTDTINIHVVPNPEIIIYNTFTPNLDGTNDTWIVENISQYPDNHLRIYNRNGHLVYEKIGYNNEWDGKYFGSDLPAATYYFVLEIEGFDTFKGDVTIIR